MKSIPAAEQPRLKIRARGLLFDMDGILISSLGSVERSWEKWGRERGLDVREVVRVSHGMRAIDTVRKILPQSDLLAELRAIEDIEIADNEGLLTLAGVAALLDSLPHRYWTVVTSATERLARSRLAFAGIVPPERFVSAESVSRGKPDPEPYKKGAGLLGLPAEDCIAIEDSSSGSQAGRTAGCKVLATTFSHSIEQLPAADWIVPSLAAVTVTVLPGNQGLELEFEPLPRAAAEARNQRG